MATKNFIGFDSLEKLLANADPNQPINAMPIVQPGKPGRFGITPYTQMILVTQAGSNGETLYCRIITGRYQMMAGDTPLPSRHDYPKISESAWAIVQEEIKDRGLQLREAMVALPRNLMWLDGRAECLQFNKESDRYERATAQEMES